MTHARGNQHQMKLQVRIELLARLGDYLAKNDTEWEVVKDKAFAANPWFLPAFTDIAAKNISAQFLKKDRLEVLASQYQLPHINPDPKKVGIVMAGNIPLVGFHDLLCVFLTGHYALIKPSSKDDLLMKHLVKKMINWEPEAAEWILMPEFLKGCDAYIATGSNNTSRYFEYYFRKQPSIIRKNRTSVAILNGRETKKELEALADDVYSYFGLGCRNVTKLYVPKEYDFVPLIEAFKKYEYLADHNKYRNNYDYNLAVHLLNRKYFMSNESILLIEDPSIFSPIGQLHYEYYTDADEVRNSLKGNEAVQVITGDGGLPFGAAQAPGITDYADGVDTMAFLVGLTQKETLQGQNGKEGVGMKQG
jgi:hypothetical protein